MWWRGIMCYLAGDLREVERMSDRLTHLATRRSAHLRSHALALVAHMLFARGEWEDLAALGHEIAELVSTNPGTQFCLAAAGATGYAVVADAIRGRRSALQIDEFVALTCRESVPVRDGNLLLPMAVCGRDLTALSRAAFDTSGVVWDREVLDPMGLKLTMALVVQGRWKELESALSRIDHGAARGSALARAIATAARGEMAGGTDRDSSHSELRALGYIGVSETLAFRSA
jgi:hypothetical protein